MKTKNNVQQTISKSLVVVISLVLINLTVNAQDFWNSIYENNGSKDIALAMVEVNTETKTELNDAISFSAFFEVESEEALEVEEWMMNENNFITVIYFEAEIESPLGVESWMTDEKYFNPSTSLFIEETDDELELEEWMISDKVWNN